MSGRWTACVGSARTGTRVLLEVLGPAGAGKSTLIAAMEARDPRIRRAKLPSRGELLLAYARHAARFRAARRRAGGRPLARAEARALSIAAAWSHRSPEGLVVFDHGPLFRLVKVRAFGPPLVEDDGFTGWWQGLFERWAALLDAVVFLDASDNVLVHRIRTRSRHHAAKALDDASAAAFVAAYRDGFDRVRHALAERGTRVVTIDAAATEPLAMADQVLAAMEELDPAHHDRTHEAWALDGKGPRSWAIPWIICLRLKNHNRQQLQPHPRRPNARTSQG